MLFRPGIQIVKRKCIVAYSLKRTPDGKRLCFVANTLQGDLNEIMTTFLVELQRRFTVSSAVEWIAVHCFPMTDSDKHLGQNFRPPNAPNNEKR